MCGTKCVSPSAGSQYCGVRGDAGAGVCVVLNVSPRRPAVSIVTFAVMLALVYTEISYYMTSFRFRFEPDVDMDARLPIHVDITVGMPCAGESATAEVR